MKKLTLIPGRMQYIVQSYEVLSDGSIKMLLEDGKELTVGQSSFEDFAVKNLPKELTAGPKLRSRV